MSVLQKIFGSFNTPVVNTQQGQTQPQNNMQQQAQGTPGNIPPVNNMPASVNNPTVPANNDPVVASNTNTNTNPAPEGLDKFADMWNIPADQLPKPPESPFAGVTPEAIQTIAGKTDFSKVVTPEMMTAISAGGEQAAAAMITALNAVAQNTYATSAQASMKLIDAALAKQREQFTSELPNLIQQQTVTNSLRTQNPIFKHPAAAPMLDMFAKQLQLKNPTADAATIQAQAQEFLISFANAANPQKQEASSNSAVDKTDWSDFF